MPVQDSIKNELLFSCNSCVDIKFLLFGSSRRGAVGAGGRGLRRGCGHHRGHRNHRLGVQKKVAKDWIKTSPHHSQPTKRSMALVPRKFTDSPRTRTRDGRHRRSQKSDSSVN